MTSASNTRPDPEPTSPLNAIEVRGLSKTYHGGVEAVKAIDFEVAAGEVFGLLGPNRGSVISLRDPEPGPKRF